MIRPMESKQPTDPSPKTNEFTEKLASLVMMKQRTWMLTCSEIITTRKISYTQFLLLVHLSVDDSIAMSNVAVLTHHSTAATTGLVKKLEQLGYVRRDCAEFDRRKVLVGITASGKKLVDEIHEILVLELAKRFSCDKLTSLADLGKYLFS